MSQAVRAIIFDFSGVFTRDEGSQAQLRRYDALLEVPPDTLHAALYSGEPWELVSTGRISQDDYWERVGRPYEGRLPAEFASFRQGPFWAEPINEEMVALARRLRRAYPLALCSNALPELLDILAARPDLRELFDVQVVSVQVGLRKPDPAILQLTAERLGLPSEACLLIDDKLRNTISAQSIGMPAIAFESMQQLKAALLALGVLPVEEPSHPGSRPDV